MVTASGQSPAVGHTASRGAVAGPSPLIPTAFYSKGMARALRPRGQRQDVGSHSDGEPGRRALPWHLIRKHGCGGHRLSGSDAVSGTMGTAYQAARLARPSLGPSLGGRGIGPILQTRKRRRRVHEQVTSLIPALFLP